jgi:glyoxylase I family protein
MNIVKFRHVALIVEDLEKMRNFYETVMGFSCVRSMYIDSEDFRRGIGVPGSSAHGVVLRIQNTDVEIEMFQILPLLARNKDISSTNAPGFRHLAFSVTDLDAIYQELIGIGVSFVEKPIFVSEPKEVAGLGFAYFKDPEGNLIELNQLP